MGDGYARCAFDFLDRICGMQQPEQIFDAFHAATQSLGFETFIMGGLPDPSQRLEQTVLLKHWPDEWYSIYTHGNYVRDDPVIWSCRRTVEPFLWSDAPYDPSANRRSHQVMCGAAEFGMTKGLCIPIHGLSGMESAVSLGGLQPDLTPRARAAVHLMGVYAFNTTRRILQPGSDIKTPLLSAREREVMSWTAAGKSAWELSCILNISANTANKHISAATRKLNAVNKTQAVAEALRRGEIHI